VVAEVRGVLVVARVVLGVELLFFLDGTRAKPLLVVIDIFHRERVPGDEVEVCKQLETQRADLVDPSDDHAATPTNRLVLWLTEERHWEENSEEETDEDSEEEPREEEGHRSWIKRPLPPPLRIVSSERRHKRLQLFDGRAESPRFVPGPLERNEAKARVEH